MVFAIDAESAQRLRMDYRKCCPVMLLRYYLFFSHSIVCNCYHHYAHSNNNNGEYVPIIYTTKSKTNCNELIIFTYANIIIPLMPI